MRLTAGGCGLGSVYKKKKKEEGAGKNCGRNNPTFEVAAGGSVPDSWPQSSVGDSVHVCGERPAGPGEKWKLPNVRAREV
jgi:hypothetical protein